MFFDHVRIPDTFLEASEADGDVLGLSREGRPVRGCVLGRGPNRATLVAGAHADEPAGPTTLRALVRAIRAEPGSFGPLLDAWTLTVIPHVNPDGEARNASWRAEWPDCEAYMRDVVRERPGEDIEFGYPDLREENRIVAEAMRAAGPVALHASLHGMGFSDGAMLLIEKNWAYRTEGLQAAFVAAAGRHGLRLHDHNRKGEKGFFRIAAGFTTTPEGAAMRTYFRSHAQPETADLFRDSSMEYARSLGGDPLSIVTELPLFLVKGPSRPEHPDAYMAFRDILPEIRLHLAAGRSARDLWQPFGLVPLSVQAAVDIHLETLGAALDQVVTSTK